MSVWYVIDRLRIGTLWTSILNTVNIYISSIFFKIYENKSVAPWNNTRIQWNFLRLIQDLDFLGLRICFQKKKDRFFMAHSWKWPPFKKLRIGEGIFNILEVRVCRHLTLGITLSYENRTILYNPRVTSIRTGR